METKLGSALFDSRTIQHHFLSCTDYIDQKEDDYKRWINKDIERNDHNMF
jgi:hypothetical protein